MPIIPTVQRKVGPEGMPGTRINVSAPTAAFGGGVGQAITQTGHIIADYQNKIDTASIIDAENKLRSQTNEYLHKDILQRQGLAAATSEKDFADFYGKAKTESMKGLSKRAQGIFASRSNEYQSSLMPKIWDHTARQADVATNDALVGSVDVSTQSFGLTWQDTKSAETIQADIKQKTAAALHGRDPAFITKKADDLYNGVLVNTLKTLQANDDLNGVNQFVALYGDKIDKATIAPILGWANKENRIVKEATIVRDTMGAGIDEETALQQITANYGPDSKGFDARLYNNVYEKVQARYVDKRRIEREERLANKTATLGRARSANSLSSAIAEIDNDESLTPEEKVSAKKQLSVRYGKAVKGTMTDEEQGWFQYEKSGLNTHLKLINEYKVRVASGEEMDEKYLNKVYHASNMVNAYWKFIYGGGFQEDTERDNHSAGNPFGTNDIEDVNEEEKQAAGAEWYNNAYLEIKAAHPDATDEEIQRFMTKIITQNGG